jgi:hypothetical protein
MSKLIQVLGAAALALTATTASAETAEERGAAKFAELTEGRVAGEPKSCVTAMRPNDIEVIENVGLAYEQGDTLWIARATDPRSLGRNDVPIIDRFGSQLCRQDMIRTIDRSTQFVSGVVFLEDFVPYTKQG